VDRGQGDRGRAVDPRLRPGHRGRGGDREARPVRPPGDARRLVQRTGALDRRGRTARRPDDDPDLRLPADVQRLLPLRPGLSGGAPRHRQLRRAGGAPAVLARGSGLRGEAGRGDRQRGHRGHAGPGPGRNGGARDDAAAVPHLHPGHAGRGCHRRPAPQTARRAARVRGHPVEERRGDHADLQAQPAPARHDPRLDPENGDQAAAGRVRRRHPLQAGVQPVGPAAVPGARRRPVHGYPGRASLSGHRSCQDFYRTGRGTRIRHRAGGRHRGDRDRTAAAGVRRHRAHRGRPARAAARDDGLQGHDAERRTELRVHHRLHERVLDPQGGPGERVRLPAAPVHGRPRLRHVRAGQRRPGGHSAAAARLPGRLRAPVHRSIPAGRLAGSVAAGHELRARRGDPAARQDR